jgi:hypothetical protein
MTGGGSFSPISPNLLFSSLFVLFSPIADVIDPLRGTAMKLVRTFDIGRDSLPVTASGPAGDRSREGGETEFLFCSNSARRLLT